MKNLYDFKSYKWWHWLLVGLVVSGIIGSVLQSNTPKPNPPKQEAKQEVAKDEICDKARALKYVEKWEKQKVGIGFSANPAGIITKRATWLALGEENQIALLAIVDCAAVGQGKHLNGLKVFDLQQNEIAKYDVLQLAKFREMAKPVLTKEP